MCHFFILTLSLLYLTQNRLKIGCQGKKKKLNKWKISTKHQETLTADSADQGWNFRKGRKHNTNQYIPLEMSSLNIKFEKVVWYCGYLGKKVLCHGDERH